MKPEQLREILTQHGLWLDTDGQQGQRANLAGANLEGANLRQADLTRANLAGADLTGAWLTRAWLTGADLTNADLAGAYLTGTNLTGADLAGADLTGACLAGASLTGANLYGANLSHTCVIGFYVCNYFGYYHRGNVRIGCEEHTLNHWLSHYKDIGAKHDYLPAEVDAIGMQLRTVKRQAKLLNL